MKMVLKIYNLLCLLISPALNTNLSTCLGKLMQKDKPFFMRYTAITANPNKQTLKQQGRFKE